VSIVNRKRLPVGSEGRLFYAPDEDLVPPMPIAGDGHGFHVTGLTHDERGYPAGESVASPIRSNCTKERSLFRKR